MKKLLFTVATLLMTGSLNMASAGIIEMGTSFGIGYPDHPEQVSFDIGVSLDYQINPFLSVGIESGFDWVRKEYDAGYAVIGSIGTLSQTEKFNFYSFPLLGMITVSIPIGESPITPFVSGGAGYSWTIYENPFDDWVFQGFTWQIMTGVVIKLGERAMGMKVLIEAGYRGTMTERETRGVDLELEMSSPIVRAGVVFPLYSGGEW